MRGKERQNSGKSSGLGHGESVVLKRAPQRQPEVSKNRNIDE